MNLKSSFAITLFLVISSTVFSQSYVGLEADNYAGIHGVTYNPSNIVGSNYKTDINLISISAFLGSDYYGTNFSNVINSGFDIEDDTERFVSDNNNFAINADVLGPSFFLNLDKKSSIGLITRGRTFVNLNEINGELAEAIDDDFEDDENFSFDSQNLNATVHTWAEIGIAYGRILLDKQYHILKRWCYA
ncbi:DUF5723 family protein [Psychroserpens sp. XS_ASV72]|uniref:DUF5723 family protein n=1 Tax=Psychroserpens sp. XS_ASV72 TaxID=3241293 RepID=UPI003515CD9B